MFCNYVTPCFIINPTDSTEATTTTTTTQETTAQEVTQPTTVEVTEESTTTTTSTNSDSCGFISNSDLSASFSDGTFYQRGQSADFGGFNPEKAIDGIGMPHDTFAEMAVSDQKNTEYLQIDIANSQIVNRVDIWPRGDKSDNGRYAGLSVKLAGNERINSCVTTDCLSSSCIRNIVAEKRPISFHCDAIQTDYVRISNTNSQYLFVPEVQIGFDCDGEAASTTPETTTTTSTEAVQISSDAFQIIPGVTCGINQAQDRVVGGYNAELGQFPWQAFFSPERCANKKCTIVGNFLNEYKHLGKFSKMLL